MKNQTISKSNFSYLVSFIICLVSFILPLNSYSQITRGVQPGEIYIPSTWYYQGGQNNFDAIFYTPNHGETLEIKYVNNVGSGNMLVGSLISDATDGVIYCNNNALWISYDSASTWSFIEDIGTDKRYASGCTEGEIYKYCKNPTSFLYRSTDFGQTFMEINAGVFGFPEVGTDAGELYFLTGSTWPVFDIDLLLSTDYGYNFDTIFVDTITAGYYLSGNLPVISRGVIAGEIYIVSWHLPANFHIFHSLDYGQNFELKFVSEECDFYFENYYFTAGKETGEFYVVKHIPWVDGINTELYIYYSNDTASTFTEYYHFLDENFPVNTNENEYNNEKSLIKSYPNPFRNYTRIMVSSKVCLNNATILIFDMAGRQVRRISTTNENELIWDGTDNNGNEVNEGIYFYSLMIDNRIISTNKIIFIN